MHNSFYLFSEDVDECTKNPCLNNGTCLNNNGSYSCVCDEGWIDQNCDTDVNECVKIQPCQNNGTCHNSQGSYSCDCSEGWQGPNCEDGKQS